MMMWSLGIMWVSIKMKTWAILDEFVLVNDVIVSDVVTKR